MKTNKKIIVLAGCLALCTSYAHATNNKPHYKMAKINIGTQVVQDGQIVKTENHWDAIVVNPAQAAYLASRNPIHRIPALKNSKLYDIVFMIDTTTFIIQADNDSSMSMKRSIKVDYNNSANNFKFVGISTIFGSNNNQDVFTATANQTNDQVMTVQEYEDLIADAASDNDSTVAYQGDLSSDYQTDTDSIDYQTFDEETVIDEEAIVEFVDTNFVVDETKKISAEEAEMIEDIASNLIDSAISTIITEIHNIYTDATDSSTPMQNISHDAAATLLQQLINSLVAGTHFQINGINYTVKNHKN